MPNILSLSADLIVEAQDWPNADKIAARIHCVSATVPENAVASSIKSPSVPLTSLYSFTVQSQVVARAETRYTASIRNTLPPGILSEDEITPAIAQKMQAGNQQQEVEQAAGIRKMQSDFLKTQAEAAKDFAQARHYVAQTDAIPMKLQHEAMKTASEVSSRELQDSLDAISVAHGQ